ncbi:hypothetical protein OH76DRAFT_452994 [Lentinus brumalis]|uniref:Uncharacterized protein n=1 Tax=Lentinus brumalis TaxID=2498619 RepID=A0A371DD77_9APHY|nr:hypothetical protein OH76DRAFT_452994 [Polyporus brumalis]
MFFKAVTAFAFAFLGVQAAPMKRDDASSATASASASASVVSIPLPGFGNLNATYLPQLTSIGFPINPTQTPDLNSALSFVQANTQAVGSVLGTATVRELEAAIVLAQATSAIGPSQSQFSARIEVLNATPIVEVSNIGGDAITLATGTAAGGVMTTMGGVVFTAAPAINNGAMRRDIPASLLAGVGAVLGSVVMGALAVW